MKFLTLNLLSLISGKELNDYQKKLAKQEYDKLINLVEELENKPSSFDDVMSHFPSNPDIWKWWQTQKFQKEQGEQEYTMIYEIDLPKILKAFTEHFLNYS